MNCSNCGISINLSDRFCSNCGNRVNEEVNPYSDGIGESFGSSSPSGVTFPSMYVEPGMESNVNFQPVELPDSKVPQAPDFDSSFSSPSTSENTFDVPSVPTFSDLPSPVAYNSSNMTFPPSVDVSPNTVPDGGDGAILVDSYNSAPTHPPPQTGIHFAGGSVQGEVGGFSLPDAPKSDTEGEEQEEELVVSADDGDMELEVVPNPDGGVIDVKKTETGTKLSYSKKINFHCPDWNRDQWIQWMVYVVIYTLAIGALVTFLIIQVIRPTFANIGHNFEIGLIGGGVEDGFALFAIGAFPRGVFCIGGITRCWVSIGGINLALVSFGGICGGLFCAVGMVSGGMGFSLGQVAVGGYVYVSQLSLSLWCRKAQAGFTILRGFFDDDDTLVASGC